jgi:hypothetical protein
VESDPVQFKGDNIQNRGETDPVRFPFFSRFSSSASLAPAAFIEHLRRAYNFIRDAGISPPLMSPPQIDALLFFLVPLLQ